MTTILFLLLTFLGIVKSEDASLVVLALVFCIGCDVTDFLVTARFMSMRKPEKQEDV